MYISFYPIQIIMIRYININMYIKLDQCINATNIKSTS